MIAVPVIPIIFVFIFTSCISPVSFRCSVLCRLDDFLTNAWRGDFFWEIATSGFSSLRWQAHCSSGCCQRLHLLDCQLHRQRPTFPRAGFPGDRRRYRWKLLEMHRRNPWR
jgi:hypothetical protein